MNGGLIALIIVGVVILSCVLCCVCSSVSNSNWRKDKQKQLNAASEVIKTAKGDFEFSKKGNAPYILISHGVLGCHDGVSGVFDYFVDGGIGVIAVSRPGYGRTPSSTGKTPAEQADALAALLDELKIDKVAMFGNSGGGPTAYTFAQRHPDRTTCLIQEASCSGLFDPGNTEKAGTWMARQFMTSVSIAKQEMSALEKNPASAFKALLDEMSTYDEVEKKALSAEWAKDQWNLDVAKRLFLQDFGKVAYPHAVDGMLNDVANNMERIPLDEIKVPSLIIHGDKDKLLPVSQAQQAVDLIPGAELCIIEGGWHLMPFGPNAGQKLYDREVEFAKKHSGQA